MAVRLTARFCDSVKPGEVQVGYPDDDVAGLELRVSPGGAKVWSFRYRTLLGRQARMTIGRHPSTSLVEARKEARRLRSLVDDGGDPAAARRTAKAAAKTATVKTFDDLVEAYFTACETGEWRPKRKQKRPRSLRDERNVYRLHVKKVLGGDAPGEIKKATVRNLLRGMVKKGIGAQTNRAHALVRAAFNFAIAEEILDSNPALGITAMAPINAKARTLSDEEWRAFWPALMRPEDLRDVEGEKVHVGRPMAIALQLTALLLQRRGEIAGMRVDELNLDQGLWLVPGERMKGGRPHMVPLPPLAVDLIREALTLAAPHKLPDGSPSPCVFPSPRSAARAYHPDSLTHAMAAITTALGIDGASPHDLRRTGSTALTSERIGVSGFVRSQVLGHSSDTGGGASVSSVHYDLNSYLVDKRRALVAWEGLLLEIVGERKRPENVRRLG